MIKFLYMKESNEKHNAIEKALSILTLFIPNNQELGTIEISHILGFHKATVSRTLLLLTQNGFLERDAKSKKFRLGPVIFNLGLSITRSLKNNLVTLAKPYLDDLRNESEESVILEILSGKNIIMAYIAEGPRRVRHAGSIGDTLPIHVAAGAKSILAFSPTEVWDNLLDKKLPRLTPNTITEPEMFKDQLREIRQDGVSFDVEEHDIDISAVGAPILDAEGFPVAAVVVAGPSNRISKDKNSLISLMVKSTALKISKRLYYS